MIAPAEPGLEPAFHVAARLGPIEDHGPTRAGHRRVIPIVGGSVTGALEAEILAGGADWQVVRPDGTIEIDTRYSARGATGGYLHLRTSGVRSGSPEVLAALVRGEQVDPSDYYFRLLVHVETADPAYSELERSLYVASAVRDADLVRYTAYRVT